MVSPQIYLQASGLILNLGKIAIVGINASLEEVVDKAIDWVCGSRAPNFLFGIPFRWKLSHYWFLGTFA